MSELPRASVPTKVASMTTNSKASHDRDQPSEAAHAAASVKATRYSSCLPSNTNTGHTTAREAAAAAAS